jgi:hypothetical protein
MRLYNKEFTLGVLNTFLVDVKRAALEGGGFVKNIRLEMSPQNFDAVNRVVTGGGGQDLSSHSFKGVEIFPCEGLSDSEVNILALKRFTLD